MIWALGRDSREATDPFGEVDGICVGTSFEFGDEFTNACAEDAFVAFHSVDTEGPVPWFATAEVFCGIAYGYERSDCCLFCHSAIPV